MNIFEIFCSGDGRINEPNMTSALHFLLDPYAPHGLGIASLAEFLAPISKHVLEVSALGRSSSKNTQDDMYRLIRSFERIEITLEEKVFNPIRGAKQSNRDIDLTIRCFDSSLHPLLVIALENKILHSSTNDVNQLSDEYLFMRTKLAKDYPGQDDQPRPIIPIIFIYLTPDNQLIGSSLAQWNSLDLPIAPSIDVLDFKAHYAWRTNVVEDSEFSSSVINIAKTILQKEQNGMINPASSHASLFLRSMIKYVDNNFAVERELSDRIDPVNNRQEVLTAAEFWAKWGATKRGSLFCAQLLHQTYYDFFVELQANQVVGMPEIIFSKTRIGFFRNGERLVAIMLQSPTTNGRVTLVVKWSDKFDFAETLKQFMEKDQVASRIDGEYYVLEIPVDMPLPVLQKLVRATFDCLI